MGAVLLGPSFVVEGIDCHDHVRAVTSGLDVDDRQVLIRLVAGHEVDQRQVGEAGRRCELGERLRNSAESGLPISRMKAICSGPVAVRVYRS